MKPHVPMIVYTHGGGRLGNQILRWVHWLAWARAHSGRVEVLNLAFWPYAACFASWQENPGCVFPPRRGKSDMLARLRGSLPNWMLARAERRVQRAVHAAGRHWPGGQAIALDDARLESIDLDDPAFFARIADHAVTTCSGWKIAGWGSVAEQQNELRALFRPAPEFARRAEKFIAALRAQHEVVIGVFVRQGDYRAWQDGRFWFSTADYAKWIRQLLDLHAGRRVAIVVAADEWQDPALFKGLPCHFSTGSVNAGGHWFESFVELSLCDFVVSPPSTFGATAAFVGAVPLWPVVRADQEMAFDQKLADPLVGAARHPWFSLAVK